MARRTDSKTPFMGMVTFGHSFGGQVVFKAVAETIEKELASGKPGPLQVVWGSDGPGQPSARGGAV